jgi:hypothetical protein
MVNRYTLLCLLLALPAHDYTYLLLDPGEQTFLPRASNARRVINAIGSGVRRVSGKTALTQHRLCRSAIRHRSRGRIAQDPVVVLIANKHFSGCRVFSNAGGSV